MSAVEECYRGTGTRIFRLNRDRVIAALRERAHALLAERPEVRQVRLFGSLNERRAGPGSDADLLLVLRESATALPERIPEYARHFTGVGLPCDVFPYTVQDIETNRLAAAALTGSLLLASRETAAEAR